jgi:hypothetical protein
LLWNRSQLCSNRPCVAHVHVSTAAFQNALAFAVTRSWPGCQFRGTNMTQNRTIRDRGWPARDSILQALASRSDNGNGVTKCRSGIKVSLACRPPERRKLGVGRCGGRVTARHTRVFEPCAGSTVVCVAVMYAHSTAICSAPQCSRYSVDSIASSRAVLILIGVRLGLTRPGSSQAHRLDSHKRGAWLLVALGYSVEKSPRHLADSRAPEEGLPRADRGQRAAKQGRWA